jgi:hypothetical protein
MLCTPGGMIKEKEAKRKGVGIWKTLKGVYHIPTPW